MGGKSRKNRSGDGQVSAGDFGQLFRGFLEQAVTAEPKESPHFLRRLRAHFGEDPSTFPTVKEEVAKANHPNFQTAIDSYLAAEGRDGTLIGIMGGEPYRGLSIAGLILPNPHMPPPTEGPVEHHNVRLADDRVLPCVAQGVYLITSVAKKYAVLIASPQGYAPKETLHLEVMAPERDDAAELLAALRKAMREYNVYRGQVVSIEPGQFGNWSVKFHRLRPIARKDIVLPEGILNRVERQTIGFSKHSEALLKAGRHLKRGLLLYGPPGTGKTLTAMYIATQMKDRTTFLLTGRGLGMVESSCAMARLLQPATVIIEDIDLIAEERTREGAACTSLLFELLNQMDGLAEDADIVFLLTTNRPDILEPALASRPGRIDLAVEVPAPDAECRRRLFELYGNGLHLQIADLDRLIQSTEGVSAAFIRELLRKAALIAADESEGDLIQDQHLDSAMHELAVQGGELLRSLLGVQAPITPLR